MSGPGEDTPYGVSDDAAFLGLTETTRDVPHPGGLPDPEDIGHPDLVLPARAWPVYCVGCHERVFAGEATVSEWEVPHPLGFPARVILTNLPCGCRWINGRHTRLAR